MSPRYEVIKRLCLPSGAALPSLLSPLALGKPRSEQPCGQAPWGGTEAPHRPPQPQPQDNLGSAGPCPSHPAMPLSWKQILSPQAGHLAAVQLIT